MEQGEELIEGYDLHVGGGVGAHARIGRLIRAKIPFDALKPMLLALLRAWQGQPESFQNWTAALSDDVILGWLDGGEDGASPQTPPRAKPLEPVSLGEWDRAPGLAS